MSDFTVFKSDLSYINLFVGGEIYPVQLRTICNPETCGTYFKERTVKAEVLKLACVQWDNSPNHIKYRMDIDRDGLLFRQILQYMRNGRKTSLPDDKYVLQQLMNEAEFFGMEIFKMMIKRRLWKITGKAIYYSCYSDSD